MKTVIALLITAALAGGLVFITTHTPPPPPERVMIYWEPPRYVKFRPYWHPSGRHCTIEKVTT